MALRDKYGTFVAFYLTFEIPVLASRKREKAFPLWIWCPVLAPLAPLRL